VFPGTAELMTPFFFVFNKPYSDELRVAGARAFHRWAADFLAPAKGRLIGTAEPGPIIGDEAIKELRFAADHGLRGVYLPGSVESKALPPLTDRYFERFWAACDDMQLVLTVHVGWGEAQGNYLNVLEQIKKVQSKLKAEGKEEWTSVKLGKRPWGPWMSKPHPKPRRGTP
jgi:predicted TIM-barrel fold metal-dependent hydrolase